MRIPTFAIVIAALCLGGIGAWLWKLHEADTPDRDRQSMSSAPLTETESTIHKAAPLPDLKAAPLPNPPSVPNAAPVVERGTGDPKQVMAANDQNGDGRVTKQEADAANKSLSQMWDAYDTNKDGIVDAEEVAQVNATYFAVAKTQARKTGPDAIIMANDKDGDGIVTRAEAQQVNRSLIANWSMYDLNKDGRTDRYEIARALAE